MATVDTHDHVVCIYCLTVSDGTGFSREHIIPQNIGGTLFVDNLVCEKCNSDLGRLVDCEFLKVPDIVTALENLGIPFDREGIYRSYYETVLVSEADRLRARATKSGFQLVPQQLKDGSRITPGHDLAVAELQRTLHRDSTLRKAGITEDTILRELSELERRFSKARLGEEVRCDSIGLVAVKRSERLHAEVTPKSAAMISRAVAKIAFEWMFSCFGRRFIEAAPWTGELRDLVCGSEDSSRIFVFRSEPVDPTIRRVHQIHVLFQPSFTKVVISLFGGIEYSLIAPSTDPSVMDDFRSMTDTPDGIGIAFQQDLATSEKRFFALRADGTRKYLGTL